MDGLSHRILEALLLSAGMAWDVTWSLVLGFALSGLIQALVPAERMRQALGRDGIRQIALATALGAASSSCSYASAAVSRTLFKRGAALVPSLAFLFASTNLVLELGLVLWFLMGWQFTVAEWVGGLVLIGLMTLLVRLTVPRQLVEAARRHPEPAGGHQHDMGPVEGDTLAARLRNPQLPVRVAHSFVMDLSMLWKDLAIGFLVAGLLGTLLDVYRKYYGWRMTAYLLAVFYAVMVAAGLVMDLAFTGFGLVPPHVADLRARVEHFSLDYTFWLDLLFGALAVVLFLLNRRHPMTMHHPAGDASHDHS